MCNQIENTNDNKGIEFWYNRDTGNFIEVYERNNVFVRYQQNRQTDITLQGHTQEDWETFSKNHQFIYQGEVQ